MLNKPKLFIGSSSEALEIANAIQENLNYDAEVTVWNQGVFKLSSTAINDLISALAKSDFAIFVFNPDDIGIIRQQQYSIVRDNVIFELGLFIGKLGQRNVFYLVPENETIHLPTDLLGVQPGYYNCKRTDKNLLAALGPFCNQVRSQLKEFRYINLQDLNDESEAAKQLAMDQPFGYEHLILAELIESRLAKSYLLHMNLRNGTNFVKSQCINVKEYFNFYHETIEDFQRFIKIFSHIIDEEIPAALGPPGVPSNFSDLKCVSDKILNLSRDLFEWEKSNEQLIPPEGLTDVKLLLRGTSDAINSQLNKLPSEIRRVIKANQDPNNSPDDCIIKLVLEVPPQIEHALTVFQNYYKTNGYM